MKAIMIEGYGATPRIADMPIPTLGPDQVLIQQKATSLNPVDPGRASGALKHVFPLQFPFIPGGEIVGTILALGESVQGFSVGQEVVGFNGVGGGYAEQAVVDAARLTVRPENVSVEEAAASLLVGRTAIQAVELLGLHSGQTLLIQGGSGGVGVMAIQIAKQQGVHVIATASAGQETQLRQLGTDQVVDRTSDIGSLTGAVDAVLDLIGGPVLARSYDLVKSGGTLVTANQPPDPQKCAARQIRAQQVISDCTGAGIRDVLHRLETGKFRAVIQGEQSVWDLARLWQRPQSGPGVGKIVYTVGPHV